jgi:tetratricopeptide (TPR) repeat protein
MSASTYQKQVTGVETMVPRIASQTTRAMIEAIVRQSVLMALIGAGAVVWAQGQQKAATSPFHEAESLLEQHRLAEARTEALQQLAKHPTVDGYNLLGIIESNRQNYDGAVDAFEHALRLSPRSTKTLNNLGNAYAAQKRLDLAENDFRSVLRIDPANADANYNLGVLLMMKGSTAEAIPHFQRVHTEQSQLNLVRAYFAAHRKAEALRTAEALAEAKKSDVQVQFSLGVLLAQEREYKTAQQLLERADALQPDSFEILFNLGQALLRTREYARAELTLNRALKLQPESQDALYLLAQSYNGQSRPLDALDVLMRAHKLAPNNADIIFLMAQVTMSQNYYEDAIPLLESGLEIAPRRPDLLAALGESYFMAGKTEKAIDRFNALLEIDKSARSYAFLGLSYRNLGRFDEAKSYFQQGLALDPHNSTCLFNLGYIAERQGDAAAAERYFQQTLQYSPDFSDALLELANLRTAARRLPEAEELLRRYVKVAHDPANGYYKLAMVERSLHETEAANRDLNVFKTMSKNTQAGPYPYEHLFDYLDNRSQLAAGARQQLDIEELKNEIQRHPNQPENLYMLAEAYLKAGKMDEARDAVQQLDALSANDYRTLNGAGVLLARYRLYDDAIRQFQAAMQANPSSDEVKFNLANAYFRKGSYPQALEMAGQISETGRKDDAYLTLMGDILAHEGDAAQAAGIFRDAIARNPDNDQNYLSLALIDLRSNDVAAAQQTLAKGQSRIPASGKIYWGLGLASALAGNIDQAASRFERALDLLPEWPGAYSTLGVFYFQIGQVDKARAVLKRFRDSSAGPSLDVSRIEQVLDRAPATASQPTDTLSAENKQQLLQFALSLADKTL